MKAVATENTAARRAEEPGSVTEDIKERRCKEARLQRKARKKEVEDDSKKSSYEEELEKKEKDM